MSLRSLRTNRTRKCSTWPEQFQLDSDACPGELPQLSGCLEDEESDGSSFVWHGGAEEVAVIVDAASTPWPDETGGGQESPVRLRHLKVAARQGHLEAMYLLAQECDDRVERIRWLTMAAEQGHLPSMHDLGLASAALHERRRWLLRAAQQGWAEAMAELGDVECS